MNDNTPKSAADLLADESFLLYCAGDEKEREKWEQQFVLVPGLRETAAEAKRLYGLVKVEMADAGAEARSFADLLPLQDNAGSYNAAGDQRPPVIPLTPSKPLLRRPWTWAAAAAILLVFILGGRRLFMTDSSVTPVPAPPVANTEPVQRDAAPGRNTATLILADGSSLLLDSAANGELASQGGTRIIKLPNDQIRYQAEATGAAPIGYNTIQTPNGGQYKLVLPDGTGVWLNAASSLRYPTAFTGKERRVSVTGEVYFEVAKVSGPVTGASRPQAAAASAMPFIVEKDGMEIKVLGTHFNVNTYADEPESRITLLEGSVAVTGAGAPQSLTLRPGQQARLNADSQPHLFNDIDVDEVMAWKNGLFDFSSADIQTIMRQIGRWYDLDVVFRGTIPQRQFSGKITRGTNLSNVLKILEQSNIHFEVENRTIVVKP